MLRIEHLAFTYLGAKAPALNGLDATFQRGAKVLVVGANGAGKSTFLAAVAGFVPHFFRGEMHGDILFEGRSLRETPLAEWVMRVGLVFANPFNQLSGIRLTVFEEVAFGLENLGVPPDEIRRRVAATLDHLGLSDLAERSPFALSGGQQQRVAIATILAMNPHALALDEPTAQLDPQGARDVFALLAALAEEERYVLAATQRLEYATPVLHEMLALREGRLAAHAPLPSGMHAAPDDGWGVLLPLRVRAERPGWRPWPHDAPTLADEAVAAAPPMGIEAHAVHYTYPTGVEALRGVSVHAQPGEVVALMGQNGAGKTTLSKMFIGLLRPDNGTVRVGEWDATARAAHELAHRVGYVFQNPHDQIFHRRIWDEVAYGPRNLGFPPERLRSAVERALALCGLSEYAEVHPYDMPLNRRRWVTIAAALAMETPVLIFDEPSGGFDREDLLRLYALLQALRRAGRTVLLISHDVGFVAEIADRVVVMAQGRVLADGAPHEVLTDETVLTAAALDWPPATALAREMGFTTPVVREAELHTLMQ